MKANSLQKTCTISPVKLIDILYRNKKRPHNENKYKLLDLQVWFAWPIIAVGEVSIEKGPNYIDPNSVARLGVGRRGRRC